MQTNMQRMTGTIKWYDKRRGYGFVAPDSGSDDIFLHHSAFDGNRTHNLAEGDRIAFSIEKRNRGLSAIDVVPVKDAPVATTSPIPAAPASAQPASPPQAAAAFSDLGL